MLVRTNLRRYCRFHEPFNFGFQVRQTLKLVTGYWLLVTGCWVLVTGYWKLKTEN